MVYIVTLVELIFKLVAFSKKYIKRFIISRTNQKSAFMHDMIIILKNYNQWAVWYDLRRKDIAVSFLYVKLNQVMKK